jgi:alpha-beta hydrolase superfamily lysophospholipase
MPTNMLPQTFTWKTSQNLEIHGAHWPAAQPKAAVCIVHGLGEHIGRYEHVAAFFSKNNIATAGFDLHGFGQSQGKKGHTDSVAAYLDEISTLIEKTREWYPGVPVFLFGQSMGGNLVLDFLLDRGSSLNGVIAFSPWISLPKPPSSLLIGFAKIMRYIWPSLTQPNGLDLNELATDPSVAVKYKADPLVHDRISVGTAVAMFDAAARLQHFSGEVPVPLLLMHGSEDQITDPKGSESFVLRSQGDVTFRPWEGLKHELHNEPQKEEVLGFVVKWMEKRMMNDEL